MRKNIRKLLFYEILDSSSLETVRAQIMEENRKFAIIWALTQMVYWTYCLFMTTRRADFLTCRSIYLTSFAICAAALVLALFAAPRVPWLVLPIALAEDIALLGAGVGIARLFAPRTILVFASVLLVPVFFISDMLSTGILLTLNAVTFAFRARSTLDPETYQWTLVNLLIFSSVGLIIGYFINKARYERYYYAESAMQLAQSNAKLAALQARYANYDEMTGLQNRRAYAEKYVALTEHMPDGCCVIMVDINGLKEMNDTRGHEARDELLIGAAECLRQSFAAADSIYRIGGDEFCFNQFFNTFLITEAVTEEEKQPYVDMILGLAKRFGRIYRKAREDGALRTDLSEKRMFSVTLHLMLAVVTRYAVGLAYSEETDVEAELRLQKDLLLQSFVIEG